MIYIVYIAIWSIAVFGSAAAAYYIIAEFVLHHFQIDLAAVKTNDFMLKHYLPLFLKFPIFFWLAKKMMEEFDREHLILIFVRNLEKEKTLRRQNRLAQQQKNQRDFIEAYAKLDQEQIDAIETGLNFIP